MTKLPFLIAWRLLRTSSYERSISTMIKLCFWGICISTFALALIASVMIGIEEVTHQKIQGIHADLIIRATGGQGLNYPKIKAIIAQEFSSIVAATSPSDFHHTLVTRKNSDNELPTVAFVTSIDPCSIQQVSSLATSIIDPKAASLTDVVTKNHVLLGKGLAAAIGAQRGDSIELLVPTQETEERSVSLEKIAAIVGGIFATGIDEFDMNGIFASEQFVHSTLAPDAQTTDISIKLQPGVDQHQAQKELAHRLAPLTVLGWYDLYPALVSALTLEKYAMLLILLLIVLIASMNTISLLFMYVTHKRRTIAVLYSLGMSQQEIIASFMFIGIGITVGATIVGLLAAVGVGFLIDHFQLISLPDIYYTSYVPAHMSFTILLSVFCAALVLSILATWYPTRQIRTLDISQILKFEG